MTNHTKAKEAGKAMPAKAVFYSLAKHPEIRVPEVAMVFAAGRGTRMRSFRADVPKPLVPVAERTLLDRVLDKLVQAGVKRAVVNISHLGEQIQQHLSARTDIEIAFSPEAEPLETGGGIVNALPLLGEQPFFAINADISWIDGFQPALLRLAEQYNARTMDALLLACPVTQTTGYSGRGDFIINSAGQVRRRTQSEISPHVFTGIQILHPRIFAAYRQMPDVPTFSLGQLFGEMGDMGWLPNIFAIVHDALWCHIGDGRGVKEAEKVLG